MSSKGKAWKKPRATPGGYRRSRDATVDAFRAASRVHIPATTGGEETRDAERQCHRKKPYPDRALAQTVATNARLDRGVTLVVYPCPHCGQWHVGG